MIARGGGGWQTILADLALILFMVSVSATGGSAPAVPEPAPEPAQAAILQAEPGAIYRSAEGGPTLGQWLAGQPADPRQRLTVVARYADGQGQAVSTAALAWARDADAAGRPARIVLEPGAADDLLAVLAFDAADGGWHETCSAAAKDHARPAATKEMSCE